MDLVSLVLVAATALATTHDPHGCPEPAHDYQAYCRCDGYAGPHAGFSYYQPRPYYYRRPPYHPRPYYVPPPRYEVRGPPVRSPGPVVYLEGPPIYVDAPPVYVEPAQIYVERPEIIVRPSDVIMASPEVHFEPCPQGANCYQAPLPSTGGIP